MMMRLVLAVTLMLADVVGCCSQNANIAAIAKAKLAVIMKLQIS
jgi:hypothetical protein